MAEHAEVGKVSKRKSKAQSILPEALDVIKQLSELCDLVGLQAYIGRKTRYGDKPGPEAWYHTRRFLAEYAPGTATEDIAQLFDRVGVTNEVDAAMFIVLNDKHIP